MPNIATVLKAEISRVARKEVRTEVEALKKASAQHRSAIATLRRQVESLQKELKRVDKRAAAPAPAARESQADEEGPRRRFSAARLAAHRSKLGWSAATYGKLVGIGGQTIYNWEQGKSRPNASQVQQLAVVKELSRDDLLKRLEASAAD
ncbi:helix-turn-helix transcriptional regulator [Variovorax sp. J22G21]|uniref:helix-turn-helix domain-containing protein n=1 Tax=Variovorax fucosicus TaxID=3053517 RepID=UPI0025781B0C|nr:MULTISPECIES: helix-turn-helix transcriptional regulator [unclassified Variovorax]MDM0038591.1 helix-turn-helix transcriptional regulator [Variovorax sp. J22R193]MDM0063367.1 helix-turn-helix transcriptional regulator [Variovorax sp. J22G21]